MTNEMMRVELKEAIDAGESALTSLKMAQKQLSSASNWGIVDMIGGGLFSTIMKRSKMSDASSYIEDAKCKLQRFQRELQDVHTSLNLDLNIGGFLSFADYFFDGFLMDYMVQSKIDKARQDLDRAIYMVQNVLRDLEMQYNRY